MINSTIVSKRFIGKEEIISILKKLKYEFEYGENEKTAWVYFDNELSLIIELNYLDENMHSSIDVENIKELSYSKHLLPIENPHCFSIEHDNIIMFKKVLSEIAQLDTNSYVIHETKDKYYPILKAIR